MDEMSLKIFEQVKNDVKMSQMDLAEILNKYKDRSYIVFAEDRMYPVHMLKDLPARWKGRDPDDVFVCQAHPGEFFTFQIAVYAFKGMLKNIKVDYTDFSSADGDRLSASAFCCFNTGGVDCFGKEFVKNVSIPEGRVQPLWFGVSIPKTAQNKRYDGEIIIKPEGMEKTMVKIGILLDGQVLEDSGDSEPWRHSRLRWLNSTIAIDDELTYPYTPLKVNDSNIECLGRKVAIGSSGLPESIVSDFSYALDSIELKGREILDSPIRFIIEDADGEVKLESTGIDITRQKAGIVSWETKAANVDIMVTSHADMEYDGYISYKVSVEAMRTVDVKDIRLEIPYRKEAAVYMMGMGQKGGYRPKLLDWKWDEEMNQDTLWMGDVNAGLMVRLKGPNYEKPFMLIYYHYKPLNIPEAWDNDGMGGCMVTETDNGSVVFSAYSGERTIRVGERLEFYFDLAITPVKPLNKEEHWNTRYYHHVPESFKEVSRATANVINVHHGNELNPFINYPFFETEMLADFVKRCHENSMKAKIYYTVKEITIRMVEFWALRSLGDEIIPETYEIGSSFQGSVPYADELLKKCLEDHYITAWRQKVNSGKYHDEIEASVLVNPMSRFNNYYLEGLQWILDHTGMDGLYFDDVAFDRSIMKRIRKILDRHHPGCLIDLHSWNYFKNNNVDDSRLAGWGNSANLYIDNFAFIDRIWFGEGFDYDESPDFWLIEISGIPYGIMGDVLNGNMWRGMIYGMTNRLPNKDNPSGVWKLWDEFGIRDSTMLGYWNPSCPVRTDNEMVLATVYKKADKSLISIASWAKEPVEVRLEISWDKLGLVPEKVKLIVPEIEYFQTRQDFDINDKIPIEPGKGWLMIISEDE